MTRREDDREQRRIANLLRPIKDITRGIVRADTKLNRLTVNRGRMSGLEEDGDRLRVAITAEGNLYRRIGGLSVGGMAVAENNNTSVQNAASAWDALTGLKAGRWLVTIGGDFFLGTSHPAFLTINNVRHDFGIGAANTYPVGLTLPIAITDTGSYANKITVAQYASGSGNHQFLAYSAWAVRLGEV